MFRIFNKDVISKELFTVNLSQQEVDVVLEGDLFKDHPELSPQACIVVEQDYPFSFPTFDREKNTIREMSLYERYKNSLYELQFNEVEYKNDILTLEAGQYVNEAGELVTVPKIEGTRVEWNWETHTWEEKATMLEIIQAQYAEYDGMDTYSTVEEMKRINPAMAEEFVNMLIELRQMAYSLEETVETQAVGYTTLPIPKPSKSLEKYLEMRKIVKLGKNN
ncbi:hypothetical protein [uncultured Fusobacterium sp.]|uniref:hypothetical protein n=1 Tax=uncultured Fusobacterium sp. TaxID=159267 RepID=UPI0025D6BF96|nr:hypothetical protein [uncultured Fusobacterium sp.]